MSRFDVDEAAARAIDHAHVITINRARVVRSLEELDAACHVDGLLQPMPSAFYASRDRMELAYWALQRGYYSLPTTELVDWLRPHVEGERAIEIGAGHGALGRALGIPVTDAKVSDRPDVRAYYEKIGQGLVLYPPDVEKLTAAEAAEKYQPSVILGAWITWKYDPLHHDRGGNTFGVDERKLYRKPFVVKYIHVGHERVHARSPMLALPHASFELPFLWARSLDPLNVVRVWTKGKS